MSQSMVQNPQKISDVCEHTAEFKRCLEQIRMLGFHALNHKEKLLVMNMRVHVMTQGCRHCGAVWHTHQEIQGGH